MKSLAKKFAPPTRAQTALVDAVLAIHAAPDAVERAFMARQLILCTLPHTDPGNVEAWTRRTGSIALGIQSGVDFETGKKIGFPYGTIPRLLLFWLTTEVQRTKNIPELSITEKRTLQLGRSLAAFMEAVGLNPRGGGKRSDAKRLHDQMDRLFSSRIGFVENKHTSTAQGKARGSMEISPDYELWWSKKRPEQGTLWNSYVFLGESFYSVLAECAVPIDLRALKALKRSPLALDLYALVCYAAFPIFQQKRPPQFIPWKSLMQQFGTDYADPHDFKRKAKAALRKIAGNGNGRGGLYPGLTVKPAKGGFMLHATRLAVPQGDSGKLIG
ncbi:MAG: replication protein RepA [Terriglobia bacterium]